MLQNFLNFLTNVYHYISNKITAFLSSEEVLSPGSVDTHNPTDVIISIPENKQKPPSPVTQAAPFVNFELLEELKSADTGKDYKVCFNSKVLPFQRTGRKTTLYKNNVTSALELPFSNAQLERISTDPDALFNVCQDYLKEHAARRVDLFFYILIAVYKTQLTFKQSNTVLQHGKGRKNKNRSGLTHACHSSLFPTLMNSSTDEEILTNSSIFSGTHFMDSMNATVELPIFANQLDSELEGKIQNPSMFRKKSLHIIQRVAMGDIDPIAGLKIFFDVISNTFENVANHKSIKKSGTAYLARKTNGTPKHIKLKLLESTRAGTFCNNNIIDLDDYVNLLLRLTPAEIAICQQTPECSQPIYLEKIQLIQNEILSTPSSKQELR